jgi:hypothetical protein
MTVATTSKEVFNGEIKGHTNWQNEIVLKVLKRLGQASTDKKIMEVSALFTEDHKPLDRNVVTRVLNDLREKHKVVDYLDVKQILPDGSLGRKVHHHYLKEEGKQTRLF